MSYSVLDNLIIGNYDDSKYLPTFAETNISETVIRNENNNCLDEENNVDSDHHCIFSNLKENDTKNKFPVGQNLFEGYDIYFNMVTHVSHETVRNILERIVTSIFLLNCLESTNYFIDNVESNVDCKSSNQQEILTERIMFAGFLFHAYSVLLSNVHAVSEHNSSGTKDDQESQASNSIKRKTTGSGLFPRAASILNHSCDPNTTCIYTNGKTQVSNL